MLKRLSKKVTAIFLSVCTLLSTMALYVPAVSAADNENDSLENYISSLYVATSADDRNGKGSSYTYIDKNLDDNSYVYLGYSLTNDFTEAITGIVFSKEMKDTLTYCGRNYSLLDSVNFNKDKGQEDLYLYYTKEQDPYGTTEYLTNLDVVGTSNSSLDGEEYKTVVRVETKLPQNLNAAYDSFDKRPYLYLGYQSEMSHDAAYQKLGNGDLASNVKSVNGIDYYNFDTDVAKNDFLVNAINENIFQYYPNVPGDATEFSTLNLKYVTNDDITAKGTIEINTSNIEHNYYENGFCKSCGAYQPAYLNSDGVYEIGNAGQLYWFASLVNGDRTHADFDSQNGSANAVLVSLD